METEVGRSTIESVGKTSASFLTYIIRYFGLFRDVTELCVFEFNGVDDSFDFVLEFFVLTFQLEIFTHFLMVKSFGVCQFMLKGLFIKFIFLEFLLSGNKHLFEVITLCFKEGKLFCKFKIVVISFSLYINIFIGLLCKKKFSSYFFNDIHEGFKEMILLFDFVLSI